jgi:hypothetical protein
VGITYNGAHALFSSSVSVVATILATHISLVIRTLLSHFIILTRLTDVFELINQESPGYFLVGLLGAAFIAVILVIHYFARDKNASTDAASAQPTSLNIEVSNNPLVTGRDNRIITVECSSNIR